MTSPARKTAAGLAGCALVALAAITLRAPLASASPSGTASAAPSAQPGLTIDIPLVTSLLGGVQAILGQPSPSAPHTSAPASTAATVPAPSTHAAAPSRTPSPVPTTAPRIVTTRPSTATHAATSIDAPGSRAVAITHGATGGAAASTPLRHRAANRTTSRRSAPTPQANRDYLLARTSLGYEASWILVAVLALCAAGTVAVVSAGGHRSRRASRHPR